MENNIIVQLLTYNGEVIESHIAKDKQRAIDYFKLGYCGYGFKRGRLVARQLKFIEAGHITIESFATYKGLE